jgi:hypothetical protein
MVSRKIGRSSIAFALALCLVAACASGGRTSSPAEVGRHEWGDCVGRRLVEVRNNGPVAVAVYGRGASGPSAATFLRTVASRDVAQLPGDGVASVYALTSTTDPRGRPGRRATQVAFRYLCE